MIKIDTPTVIFGYMIYQTVNLVVMLRLWQNNRDRFDGTTHWLVNYLFQTIALVLIIMRERIPAWISIDLANTLIAAGMLIALIGVEKFVGRRRNNFHNYLIIVVYAMIHTWYTFGNPDLNYRTLNSALIMIIFGGQFIWLLTYVASPEMKKLTRGLVLVFTLVCMVNLIRIYDFFYKEHLDVDYFHVNGFESYVLVCYLTLSILQTYSIILMYNKRLTLEIASEEEKFSKAFYASPVGILITRITDGKIFEVNEGFLKISGFAAGEVVGKTTKELGIWFDEEERTNIIEEIKSTGELNQRELFLRQKSGNFVFCIQSVREIKIKEEFYLLSIIQDLSELKKKEEMLREATAYLENLFNCANAPMIVWDNEFRITKFNHAFESLTGRSFQEMEGQKLDILFPERTKEASLSHIYQTSMGERWETVEMEVQNISGNIFTVLWNSANIYDSGNSKIIATIAQGNDITNRKIIEAELQLLNEELESKIQQRTADLNKTIAELEEQSRVFVGRELKIVELNKKMEELKNKYGI